MSEISLIDVKDFKGKVKKIRIFSQAPNYFSCIDMDKYARQKLVIKKNGTVKFFEYKYLYRNNPKKAVKKEKFKIEKDIAKNILDAIGELFCCDFFVSTGKETLFKIEITTDENEVYTFAYDYEYRFREISDFIRNVLNLENLYLMDGNLNLDIVDRIVFEYEKIVSQDVYEFGVDDTMESIYRERIVLDRNLRTLEYVCSGEMYNISHKYYMHDEICDFLDSFNANELFACIERNKEDVIDSAFEEKNYKITVDYREKGQKIIEGTFDKKSLPKDYPMFIERISKLIKFYNMGEIFDSSNYGRVRRGKGEYIFCSVVFSENSKSYYYMTDDETIKIGDYVLVPVGETNEEKRVKVVNVEYFTSENAPYPVNRTKKIIEKCEPDILFDDYV